MELRELLQQTAYADQADCIASVFEQAGIAEPRNWRNAPGRVGHICGCDIYQLVAALQQAREAHSPEAQLREAVGDRLADLLVAAGFDDVEVIRWAEDEQLLSVSGIGKAGLAELRDAIPYGGGELEESTDDDENSASPEENGGEEE